MTRKVVLIFVAISAIAFFFVALLPGRAVTADGESPRRVQQRNRSEDVAPKNGLHTVLREDEALRNGTHPFFAAFDPVRGETRTFDAPNGEHLPAALSGKEFDLFRRRQFRNFLSRDTLEDSEMEVRVHFNGVTAKETMISAGTDEDTGRRQGLKLRQLADGNNFIQLIYNMEDEIQDCEFIHREDLVDNFLREFRHDIERAKFEYGKGEDNEEYFEDDEGTIESYVEEHLEDTDSPYQMRNVTFQIIESNQDLPRDIAGWLNYRMLRKMCKRTQKNLKKLLHHSQNGDLESKKLAQERLERKKRDLMDVFRMPGTKWCGKGKRAAKYTSLGMFSRTDKCCRIHDTMCPYWIGGFEEKYGLFNWKLNTIMHCRCDKRFRACLKMAKTGAANLVGKLFFNIVQTQCFVLKPEEVCVKTSWWGKCEKKEYRKKAYLRDNIPY